MNLDAIAAGPEIDAMIAGRVMGWTEIEPCGGAVRFQKYGGRVFLITDARYPIGGRDVSFRPSGYLGHAWWVVEHMATLGWTLFAHHAGCEAVSQDGARRFPVFGPVPLAICRAALKALDL